MKTIQVDYERTGGKRPRMHLQKQGKCLVMENLDSSETYPACDTCKQWGCWHHEIAEMLGYIIVKCDLKTPK